MWHVTSPEASFLPNLSSLLIFAPQEFDWTSGISIFETGPFCFSKVPPPYPQIQHTSCPLVTPHTQHIMVLLYKVPRLQSGLWDMGLGFSHQGSEHLAITFPTPAASLPSITLSDDGTGKSTSINSHVAQHGSTSRSTQHPRG